MCVLLLGGMQEAADVTLEELGKALDQMRPGGTASIHHDLLAELFPPESMTTGRGWPA
jgi:hypothetical protein